MNSLRRIISTRVYSFHRPRDSLCLIFRKFERSFHLGMPFYAVRKGRRVGIYGTWPECEIQVKKFTGAQFKKFETKAEAQSFIDDGPSSTVDNGFAAPSMYGRKRLRSPDSITATISSSSSSADCDASKRPHTTGDDLQYTVVYTDGACISNGRHGAKGGVGVYWGPSDPRNVSEPLPSGRQTNNRAEILACARAMEQAIESDIKALEIRTDSHFTIMCITSYMPRWKKNAWRKTDGGEILNLEELLVLDNLIRKFEESGGRLKFVHVFGHQGEVGNEAADRLAVSGATRQEF